MTTVQKLLKEMQEEANTTRKMLAIVPTDKMDWQPHAKSMTVRALATHIAELPSWVNMTLDTSELDFATTPYNPKKLEDNAELMAYFETTLADANERLSKATDADLLPNWVLRNGDTILADRTKEEVLRMTYCQVVHHRAQMGVFLRMLNIPIPGSYGPSADEHFS